MDIDNFINTFRTNKNIKFVIRNIAINSYKINIVLNLKLQHRP